MLCKKLVLAIGDAETKPNSAVQAATRFIRQDKAMMIAGSVSSSVAIALQNTFERAKTLYFPIISGSSDTTGKDCRRYGFRLCHHRSEEYTTELQSIMRHSYAAFCST